MIWYSKRDTDRDSPSYHLFTLFLNFLFENNLRGFHFCFSFLISAQVPDSDEQFVPDFHSENCE